MTRLLRRSLIPRTFYLLLLLALAACNRSAGDQGAAFFPIEVDGRWGVIDRSGRVIVEPSFSKVARSTFHDHARFRVGQDAVLLVRPDKWLYVDQSGTRPVKPPVADPDKFLIDYLGRSTFAVYGEADLFKTPVTPSHFLDPLGKWKPAKELATHGEFSEGLIAVHRGGKLGFADRQGRVVIEPQFDDVHPYRGFSEGLAAVKKGDLWGYVDAQGTWIIDPQYSMAHAFDEGLARVWPAEADAPPLMIDRSGRVVHEWPDSSPIGAGFSEGLSVMWVEGIAPDGKSDLWGFLDQDGQWGIPPSYRSAKSFHEGLAPVEATDPEHSGYIDHSGRLVVPVPHAWHLEWFSRGLAWVEKPHGEKGYVDRTGNWVWKEPK